MSDIDNMRMALAALAKEPSPAKSLFLRLAPRRKFPPEPHRLPEEVWQNLFGRGALETLLNFRNSAKSSHDDGKRKFHDTITSMTADQDVVFYRGFVIRVGINPPTDTSLRIEYVFAESLLRRIETEYGAVFQELPMYYHFLIDLVAQMAENSEAMKTEIDDFGNVWARIRNIAPYRKDGFCSDVTAIGFLFGSIVRITFAEHDRDLSYYDIFGWFSRVLVRSTWSRGVELSPTHTSKQAGVLYRVLKKLSKVFTQDPR